MQNRKNDWPQLYRKFSEAEQHKDELARRRVEEAAALKEFEEWSQRAIVQLMADIKTAVEARSAELFKRTGQELEVQCPSGMPIVTPNRGPEIRFMRLGLSDAQVHIYSSHAAAGVTHIHLLPSRIVSLRENHRLVSEPGAFIVRTSDNRYELRHLRGDPEGTLGSPMSLDTLVYRAFRLLLNAWAESEPESEVAAPPSSARLS